MVGARSHPIRCATAHLPQPLADSECGRIGNLRNPQKAAEAHLPDAQISATEAPHKGRTVAPPAMRERAPNSPYTKAT